MAWVNFVVDGWVFIDRPSVWKEDIEEWRKGATFEYAFDCGFIPVVDVPREIAELWLEELGIRWTKEGEGTWFNKYAVVIERDFTHYRVKALYNRDGVICLVEKQFGVD